MSTESRAGKTALDNIAQKAIEARDQEVVDLVRDIIPQLNQLVDRIERFADEQVRLREK